MNNTINTSLIVAAIVAAAVAGRYTAPKVQPAAPTCEPQVVYVPVIEPCEAGAPAATCPPVPAPPVFHNPVAPKPSASGTYEEIPDNPYTPKPRQVIRLEKKVP
jgi:hypothetical protein